MRPGTQITLSLAFVSIMWCGIGIMIGYDLHGIEPVPVVACENSIPAGTKIKPPASMDELMEQLRHNTESVAPFPNIQTITQGVMAVGVSPKGNAKPLQTDEDGYAICSPERKP